MNRMGCLPVLVLRLRCRLSYRHPKSTLPCHIVPALSTLMEILVSTIYQVAIHLGNRLYWLRLALPVLQYSPPKYSDMQSLND